jgi:hypothetical protein
MKIRSAIILVLWLAVFAGSAFGQAFGSITGVVSDVSQARMPGVSVTAVNTATGVKTPTITNETGAYNFPSLIVGPYELEATLPSFRSARVSNIDLRANQTLRYNLTMEIASVTTSVEVTLDARELLAVSSSSVGEALSQTEVSNLPLVGGDVLNLLTILPGFREGTGGNGANNDTLAGILSSSINTTRDGLSVSDGRFQNGVFATTMINPDMVGEIRMIITPVDAEMGRGNGQVQITTRSGTNRYSGAAVWAVRNSGLDANSWGNNNDIDSLTGRWSPTVPNWSNQHQATVSFGGPILRNKTFFFALYDRNFVRTRSIVNGTVLTDTARQGIYRYFDGWTPDDADANPTGTSRPAVDALGNILTAAQSPQNYQGRGLMCMSVFGTQKVNPDTFQMVPFTQADCVGGTAVFPLAGAPAWDAARAAADSTGFMKNFFTFMPRANNFQGGDGLNTAVYRWTRTQVNNGINSAAAYGAASDIERKQFNIKVDHNFNQNHKANVGYTIERDQEGANFSNWPDGLQGLTARKPWILTTSFTSTLSPTIINEARFGVRYNVLNEFDPWEHPNSEIAEAARTFLLPEVNGFPAVFNPALLSGGNSPYNNGDYNGNRTPLYSYGDTLSWTRGVHALRFGGEVRRTKSVGYNGIPARPLPVFSGGQGVNAPSNISPTQGVLGLQTGGGVNSAQTAARNLLFFMNGSVNQGTQLYWIDDASDVQNGTWESYVTKERKFRDQILNEGSIFAKDDWKITKNLTINLGLRWEYYGVPFIGSGFTTTTPGQGIGLFGVGRTGLGSESPFNRWLTPGNIFLSGYGTTGTLQCNTGTASGIAGIPTSNCDPSLVTGVEFVGPNSPNPDKSVYRDDKNNFGPAVGFAWTVPFFGREGQTTLRGGYQMTFGGSGRNGITSDGYLGGAPGATSNASIDYAGLGNPTLNLSNVASVIPLRPRSPAVPGGTLGAPYSRAGTFIAFDPNYTTPYVENFTLSLTHQLTRKVTVDLRYAGTQGKKRDGNFNLNTNNVFNNQELFNALETVRLGGEAPIFDQMFAGLNLNTGTTGANGLAYGVIGTTVGTGANAVVQTGSLHLRRRFDGEFAEGDYEAIAEFINSNAGGNPTTGLRPVNTALTAVSTVGGRILRNGCDRLAFGQTTVGPSISTPLRCFPENYLVANPQFDNATYNTNSGSSNYHSFATQVTLRPTFGTSVQGTYTWAKSMELPASGWTNPLDRDADYRIASNSRAHEFRMNGTFDLPIGPNKLLFGNSSGVLARAIEGWKMSWTYNAFSGSPASISATSMLYGNGTPDVVGPWDVKNGKVDWGHDIGTPNQLGGRFLGPAGTYQVVTDPQCMPGGLLDRTDAMGYNLVLAGECDMTAVADASGRILLQNPLPGRRGTLGQRTMTGPGSWSLDSSMSKTFRITESKQVQLRFDATNVLNHAQPGGPNFNINSDDFGTIGTKGGTPRRFQGQLRFQF